LVITEIEAHRVQNAEQQKPVGQLRTMR